MKELEKIIKYIGVSLETKTKIIHTLAFPITMYGCKCWTVKIADEKNDSSEMWCWRRLSWVSQISRKMNK